MTSSTVALLRFSDAVASRSPPASSTVSMRRSLFPWKETPLSTWWRMDTLLKVRESACTCLLDTAGRPPLCLGVRHRREGAAHGDSSLNLPTERPTPRSIYCSLSRLPSGAGLLRASAMVPVAATGAIRTSVRVPDPVPPASVCTSAVAALVALLS